MKFEAELHLECQEGRGHPGPSQQLMVRRIETCSGNMVQENLVRASFLNLTGHVPTLLKLLFLLQK